MTKSGGQSHPSLINKTGNQIPEERSSPPKGQGFSKALPDRFGEPVPYHCVKDGDLASVDECLRPVFKQDRSSKEAP